MMSVWAKLIHIGLTKCPKLRPFWSRLHNFSHQIDLLNKLQHCFDKKKEQGLISTETKMYELRKNPQIINTELFHIGSRVS